MKQPMSFLLISALFMVSFLQCTSLKNYRLAEQNKETVRLWFEEGWNNDRNEELIERCFDPEWQDGNPLRAEQISGHEGMRQLIKSYRGGATKSHFTITHLFANESQAVLRYEVEAIHSGALFGIPRTGRSFTSTGIVLYEMKDGRILTSWQELDLSSIINQLKD
jgi:predicted ester cyclase